MLNAILLTALTYFSPAPADSIRTEVIDGKMFIIHRVEQKETLFSISRKYGVALIVVVESNPSTGSGLEVGTLIKVPYTPNKTVKTKEGIVHKVGPKETLYSISKQYGVTVDDIKSWNNLTANGLNMGQELLIKEKVSDKIPDKKEVNTHTVAASETMYAIARKYGITLKQIRDWNQLTSDELKPGQVISISSAIVETKKDMNLDRAANTEINISDSKPIVAEKKQGNTVVPVLETVVGADETLESGMALVLEGTDGNRKYLAHHRSVKPGTILRVKNNATRKEVFVRVIENLPNTEASDVVLRLSKSAFDKLGGDGKFQVEITYFK